MKYIAKHFHELTVDELFEIYKLRCSVFVVEQSCPYQDVDDADKVSIHLMAVDEKGLQGYLRIIPAGVTTDDVSIGRVVVVKRRCGLGENMVLKGIEIVKEHFNANVVTIDAQVYVTELYRRCGFVQTSGEFMIDNIPHIEMKLTL